MKRFIKVMVITLVLGAILIGPGLGCATADKGSVQKLVAAGSWGERPPMLKGMFSLYFVNTFFGRRKRSSTKFVLPRNCESKLKGSSNIPSAWLGIIFSSRHFLRSSTVLSPWASRYSRSRTPARRKLKKR